MTDPNELDDRIRRIEVALAERPTATDDDAIADRVISRLSAIAARDRDANAERVLVLASAPDAPLPPNGAVLHPPAEAATQRKWFVAQFAAELRLVLTMYFDPHYRISRTTQFALPGIAVVLIFNYFFFSVWVNITFVSPVTERLLAVVLAVVGYKLLTRELGRYRDVLAYLSRYGK